MTALAGVGMVVVGLAAAGPAAAADLPPVPAADTYATDFGTTLDVPASDGLFANDDPGTPGGLQVGYVDTTTLQGGFTVAYDDGSFTYTPPSGFVGTTTLRYYLYDATRPGLSDPATVSITVRPVASRGDAYRLGFGRPTLTVDAPGVLGNDPTDAAASASARVATTTAHGTLVLSADGSFTYTPTPRYAGTDAFTYVVEAGGATSFPATVSITVDPPNADLGVAIAAPSSPRVGKSITVRVTLTSTGPSAASDVVVGVDVGPGLTVTTATGGLISANGRTVGYAIPKVKPGTTRTFELVVALPPTSTNRRTLTAAVRSLSLVDLAPGNDRATATVRPHVTA